MLHKYFDGFLYWANWGTPRLAFRFPRGFLPGNLLAGYDFGDFVSFTHYKDCDILDIHFYEMEPPDYWEEYDLESLIPIREGLMGSDLGALYIVWLAAQEMMGSYDEEEEYEIDVPPVPPGMGKLTGAQKELAVLLRVSEELLVAAVEHSAARKASRKATNEDIAASIQRLSPERRDEYLLRLAHNEPGLSRLFLRELHELNRDKTSETAPAGERVTYATLLAESKAVKTRLERERREEAEAERGATCKIFTRTGTPTGGRLISRRNAAQGRATTMPRNCWWNCAMPPRCSMRRKSSRTVFAVGCSFTCAAPLS